MRIASPLYFQYLCGMKIVIHILLLFTPFKLFAQDASTSYADSVIYLNDVGIQSLKQGLNLRSEAGSSTTFSIKDIENQKVTAIKDVSTSVPNLYIPDYGSRITSSIYV
ncbi:MAG: hypothetical protein R3Y04_08655, partial [Rikenellaceae bacterium]